MAKKTKKGFLPRIEIIIVLVFFLSFIIWAMSKCNAKQTLYEQIATEETASAEEEESTSQLPDLEKAPNRPTSEANSKPTNTSTPRPTPAASAPPPEYSTKLFVTIDGLKFRAGPSMDSIVIMTLPMNQELIFLNEVSDTTQVISLGNGLMANERWVKVRHWKGHEGWVYGAGVNYFKTPTQ